MTPADRLAELRTALVRVETEIATAANSCVQGDLLAVRAGLVEEIRRMA